MLSSLSLQTCVQKSKPISARKRTPSLLVPSLDASLGGSFLPPLISCRVLRPRCALRGHPAELGVKLATFAGLVHACCHWRESPLLCPQGLIDSPGLLREPEKREGLCAGSPCRASPQTGPAFCRGSPGPGSGPRSHCENVCLEGTPGRAVTRTGEPGLRAPVFRLCSPRRLWRVRAGAVCPQVPVRLAGPLLRQVHPAPRLRPRHVQRTLAVPLRDQLGRPALRQRCVLGAGTGAGQLCDRGASRAGGRGRPALRQRCVPGAATRGPVSGLLGLLFRICLSLPLTL